MDDQLPEENKPDDHAATPTSDMAEPPVEGLAVEETPVLEPVTEQPAVQHPPEEPPPPPPQPSAPEMPGSAKYTIWNLLERVLILAVLFAAGIWAGLALRNYTAPSPKVTEVPAPPQQQAEKAPTRIPLPTATPPSQTRKTYQIVSGTTKLPIEGITYQLPPELPAPICDGGSCASQGTYLPGGTRLTVAARGKGQLLPDWRGRVVSDLRGQAFTVTQTSVGGRPAIAFTGDFSGATVSGYSFTKMRGVMVDVSDTLSVEFNHFTPLGVVADFAADDRLFDEIVKTVTLGGVVPAGSPSGTRPAGTTQKGAQPSTPSGISEPR